MLAQSGVSDSASGVADAIDATGRANEGITTIMSRRGNVSKDLDAWDSIGLPGRLPSLH